MTPSLEPTAISAALANFADPTVGAVAERYCSPMARCKKPAISCGLTEAPWATDEAMTRSPTKYEFRRPVDYCSGVFLVTPRQLFADLGGFSSEFAPAYYEDADYCMTLWQTRLSSYL